MEKQEQTKPVRGQNLLEWYEALISAALVLVLIFSFFFRIIQVDGYAGQRRQAHRVGGGLRASAR